MTRQVISSLKYLKYLLGARLAAFLLAAFLVLPQLAFPAAPPTAPAKPPASAPSTAPAAKPEQMAGNWLGTLKVGVIELRLGVKLAWKDGKLSGTLDSIDQGSGDNAIDAVSVEGRTLKFVIIKILASYEGTIDPAVQTIDGTWMQAGQKWPLAFKRVDAFPSTKRPQEPKKPYPYKEEEVSYESAPGVKLAATLTLPQGKGPFPAVVMITGSGPQDRDEFLLGHRPFLVLADHLTRAGVAVLRADDRGVGKSTGSFAAATDDDFVVDTLAGVKFLQGRAEINAKKIGLVGHSEGGVVGPLAAVKAPGDIAFVVMLAGVGVPVEDLMIRQGADLMKVEGLPDSLIQRYAPLRREIFKLLGSDIDSAAAEKKIKELTSAADKSLTDEERKLLGRFAETGGQTMQMILTPWFRQLIHYDPAPTLSQLKCPVLAINGERDLQVSAKENLAGIKAALEKGGNKDVEIAEFPGLNHLFQHCNTGSVSEYAKIDETFAPEAMEKVSRWILRHTGEQKKGN